MGQGTDCPLKIGPIGCPEISVPNYQSTLCNIAEERRPQLHSDGSLKSQTASESKLNDEDIKSAS